MFFITLIPFVIAGGVLLYKFKQTRDIKKRGKLVSSEYVKFIVDVKNRVRKEDQPDDYYIYFKRLDDIDEIRKIDVSRSRYFQFSMGDIIYFKEDIYLVDGSYKRIIKPNYSFHEEECISTSSSYEYDLDKQLFESNKASILKQCIEEEKSQSSFLAVVVLISMLIVFITAFINTGLI